MTFLGDVRTAISGALCSGFNTYDRAARWTANLTYPDRVDAVYPLSPAGQIANSGLALFCDRPPLAPPNVGLTTGQCPVTYTVFADVTYREGTGAQNVVTNRIGGSQGVPGPFSNARIVERPSGNGFNLFIASANDPNFLVGGDFAVLTTPITFSMVFIRDDGGLDNCYMGPPVPTPLPEADRTFPININNNSGQIVFGDGNLNVNGDLVAPFVLVAGNLFLTGAALLNTGEINLNFGGQPTEPIEPGITATPDDDTGPGDEGDEEEGPSNIIGAVVIASPVTGNGPTEIFQPDAPNIFPPKIGHLSFKVKIGSRFHWTSDINIKNQNNFIHNPTVIPAVKVVAHPNPGWAIEVTPVRGIVPGNDIVLI